MKLNKSLRIDNVNSVYNQFSTYIKHQANVVIDLEELVVIDTAGLALLLELKSLCERYIINLKFINITECVYKLLNLYQIDPSLFDN